MSDTRTYDVVGFGIATVDHLGVVESFPREDTKARLTTYTQQGGGTSATPLVACARLGLKTAYLGRLGKDPTSRFMCDDFGREGVDWSHAIVDESYAPPVAMILVNPETNSRTIVWYKPVEEEMPAGAISPDLVTDARVLYLDAHEGPASVAAAKVAKHTGTMVVVDADNLTEGMEGVLPNADVIIGSAHFARLKYDADPEPAARMLFYEFGVLSAITAGVEGSYVVTEDESFHQPAFPVDVVDTTGAGDVYHGGFVVGLLKGWSTRECAVFASATAAIKCRKLGGRAGIPTFDQVAAFLSERGETGPWTA